MQIHFQVRSHMPNEASKYYHIPVQLGHLTLICHLGEDFLSSDIAVPSPHNHPDYELYYIASGVCRITVGDKPYSVASGDFFLIHPAEYHCREHTSSSHFHLRFSIEEPTVKGEGSPQTRAYKVLTEQLSQIRHLRGRDPIVFTLLNQLHKELLEKNIGYLGNLQSLCSLILTELLRISGEIPAYCFPDATAKAHDSDCNTIDRFFSECSLSKVKIQDLADSLNMSVRQVNRILHRLYGMSFTQKLTEVRLWEVARRLALTQSPVTSISQDCGFNNYNYFYVCFREKFGMTPTEYRMQKSGAKPTRT